MRQGHWQGGQGWGLGEQGQFAGVGLADKSSGLGDGARNEQEITAFDEAEADSRSLNSFGPLPLAVKKTCLSTKCQNTSGPHVSLPSGYDGVVKPLHRCYTNTRKSLCSFFFPPQLLAVPSPAFHLPFLFLPSDASPWPCHGNPIKLCIHPTYFHHLKKKQKNSSICIRMQRNCRLRYLYIACCRDILKPIKAWKIQ